MNKGGYRTALPLLDLSRQDCADNPGEARSEGAILAPLALKLLSRASAIARGSAQDPDVSFRPCQAQRVSAHHTSYASLDHLPWRARILVLAEHGNG